MTHGTIAGILLTDLMQGRKNEWEDLYDPSRVRLRSLPDYASENINVAGQYTDYFTAGDIKSESELKPGEGAVMRDGVSKVQSIATMPGRCTRSQRFARISDASLLGIQRSERGIVHATVRDSVQKAEFIRVQRIRT